MLNHNKSLKKFFFKDFMMLSTHQAAGLAVTTKCFHTLLLPPSTLHCTGLTSGMLDVLFLAVF